MNWRIYLELEAPEGHRIFVPWSAHDYGDQQLETDEQAIDWVLHYGTQYGDGYRVLRAHVYPLDTETVHELVPVYRAQYRRVEDGGS